MLSRLSLLRVQALPALSQAAQVTSTATSASSAQNYIPSYAKTIPWERPKRAMEGGKVRLGFIPEEWFTFFYPKTGVTGPYMFGIALGTYLLSKEIYVIEHEFYTGASLASILIYGTIKYGKSVGEYLDQQIDKEEADLQETRDSEIRAYKQGIDDIKKEHWRTEAQALIFDAKKENIKIQLEAEYRARMANVYNEVKKRLDFQVQKNIIERQFDQKHMVQWIVNSVKSAITPDLEKSTMQMCINDLKNLASTVKA